MVVACCTANDRDARADLVEKSRLVMLPQHHSLDLLAETLKVYQLILRMATVADMGPTCQLNLPL